MSCRLKKYSEFVILYNKLSNEMKKSILKNADENLVKFICEACLNIIKSNISMTKDHKQRLARSKHTIRELARKNNSVTLKKKKKIIQRGGSFIPLLFSILSPILSKLIT